MNCLLYSVSSAGKTWSPKRMFYFVWLLLNQKWLKSHFEYIIIHSLQSCTKPVLFKIFLKKFKILWYHVIYKEMFFTLRIHSQTSFINLRRKMDTSYIVSFYRIKIHRFS
jgi:hypothetical protein